MTARARFWLPVLAAATVASLAVALRIAAARGELWVDELWSWELARELESPLEIFTLQHDNNHPLNTLWIWLLGPWCSQLAYRGLSIVSSLGTIPIVASLSGRRGSVPRWAGASFASAAFWLVLLGTEARGYAPAIFFFSAAVAFWARASARPVSLSGAAFILSVVLGATSHLTVAFACVGFAWDAARRASEGDRRPFALVTLPACLCGLLILRSLHMQIGGARPESVAGELASFLTHLFAPPGLSGLASGGVAFVGLALAIVGATRSTPDRIIWFGSIVGPLTVMLAAPLVSARSLFLARYLAITIPALTVFLARGVEALWNRSTITSVAVGAALLFANLERDVELGRLGRGHKREALERILSSTQGAVRASSDFPMRVELAMAFYGPRLPGGNRLTFVPDAAEAEWFVVTSDRTGIIPRKSIHRSNVDFQLTDTFRIADQSGEEWFLYRRSEKAEGR